MRSAAVAKKHESCGRVVALTARMIDHGAVAGDPTRRCDHRHGLAGVGPSGNLGTADHAMPAATATHMAILDSSGGNMLLQSALTTSITTEAGGVARWATGDYDLAVA